MVGVLETGPAPLANRIATRKSASIHLTHGLLPPIKWEIPTFFGHSHIEALWKSGFTIA